MTALIAMVRPKAGVYLVFRDRNGKRKSECLTIYGLTPKQARRKFDEFLRMQRRKAS